MEFVYFFYNLIIFIDLSTDFIDLFLVLLLFQLVLFHKFINEDLFWEFKHSILLDLPLKPLVVFISINDNMQDWRCCFDAVILCSLDCFTLLPNKFFIKNIYFVFVIYIFLNKVLIQRSSHLLVLRIQTNSIELHTNIFLQNFLVKT